MVDRQREVYLLIIAHVETCGFQPSVAELALALDVSPRSIRERLRKLAEDGLVTLQEGGRDKERAIFLHRVHFRAVFDDV